MGLSLEHRDVQKVADILFGILTSNKSLHSTLYNFFEKMDIEPQANWSRFGPAAAKVFLEFIKDKNRDEDFLAIITAILDEGTVTDEDLSSLNTILRQYGFTIQGSKDGYAVLASTPSKATADVKKEYKGLASGACS